MNRRRLSTLIALVMAVGLFTIASDRGSAAGELILDKFDEKNATEISLHSPNTAPLGSSWLVEENIGNWEVQKGKAKELSTAINLYSYDYRAVIDAGSGNADVSAEVKLKIYPNGDQGWGVVARWSGDHDWLMAFHDGVGDLILGKKVSDEDQWGNHEHEDEDEPGGWIPYVDDDTLHSVLGAFQELGRVSMDWSTGSKARTHTITIETSGDIITVLADGDLVLTRLDHGDMDSTVVGIFSRGTGKNQFEEFRVKPYGGGGSPASYIPESEPEDKPKKGKKDKKAPPPKKGKK